MKTSGKQSSYRSVRIKRPGFRVTRIPLNRGGGGGGVGTRSVVVTISHVVSGITNMKLNYRHYIYIGFNI